MTQPLLASAAGAHAADQLALMSLPMIATYGLGADARIAGYLVAAQSLAWLLVSLPMGAVSDVLPRWPLLLGSQLVTAAALTVASLAAAAKLAWLIGLAVFIAASGTVTYVVVVSALLPELVQTRDLAAANGGMEVARGAVTFGAPIAVGGLVAIGVPAMGFLAAAGAALLSAASVTWFRRPERVRSAVRMPVLRAIVDGIRFVLRHSLLRALALCAALWNFAFYALVAAYVSFASLEIGLRAALIGVSQATFGAGLIVGAACSSAIIRVCRTNHVLMGGPVLSVVGAALLLVAAHWESMLVAAAGHFLIGFGPMIWLVCLTSVRQLVTPPELLGRVGGTLQIALYGFRPLGAMVGGWVATCFSPRYAIVLVLVCFIGSCAVVAFSNLVRLRTMPMPLLET